MSYGKVKKHQLYRVTDKTRKEHTLQIADYDEYGRTVYHDCKEWRPYTDMFEYFIKDFKPGYGGKYVPISPFSGSISNQFATKYRMVLDNLEIVKGEFYDGEKCTLPLDKGLHLLSELEYGDKFVFRDEEEKLVAKYTSSKYPKDFLHREYVMSKSHSNFASKICRFDNFYVTYDIFDDLVVKKLGTAKLTWKDNEIYNN